MFFYKLTCTPPSCTQRHLNVHFPSPGHNGITTVGLQIEPQNISFQGSSKQSQGIGLQTTVQLTGLPYPSSPSSFDAIGENSLSRCNSWINNLLKTPSEDGFEGKIGTSLIGMHNGNNYTEDDSFDIFIHNPPNDDNSSKTSGKAIVGWLKIKAALQWGFFIRKRVPRIVELVEVQN